MIDAAIDFSVLNNIEFVKSDDFFRVELYITENSSKTHLQVNVLSKPDKGLRCLEFCLHEGEPSSLESTFSSFTLFFNGKFETVEEI